MNLRLQRNREINELAATRDYKALCKAADLRADADYEDGDFTDANDAFLEGHACGITAALRLVQKLERLHAKWQKRTPIPRDMGIYVLDLIDTDDTLYFVGTKEQIVAKITKLPRE